MKTPWPLRPFPVIQGPLLIAPDQHAGLYLIQLGYKIFVYSVKLRQYLSHPLAEILQLQPPIHKKSSRTVYCHLGNGQLT